MKGDEIVIPKSDLLQDEDGKFFIQFDTKDMIGIVKAEVTAYVGPIQTILTTCVQRWNACRCAS